MGTIVRASNFRKPVASSLRAGKVQTGFTLHARRTATSVLARSVDLAAAEPALGHSSPAITLSITIWRWSGNPWDTRQGFRCCEGG